jgi:hypothetical protein
MPHRIEVPNCATPSVVPLPATEKVLPPPNTRITGSTPIKSKNIPLSPRQGTPEAKLSCVEVIIGHEFNSKSIGLEALNLTNNLSVNYTGATYQLRNSQNLAIIGDAFLENKLSEIW